MALYKTLNLDNTRGEIICFIGGGGKTSSMFQLARELKKQGKRVLITTTTAIYKPTIDQYDDLILIDPKEKGEGSQFLQNLNPKEGITVLGGGGDPEEKLFSPGESLIETLQKGNYFDIIIVEADGAKKLPLKAPASHEPVIPKGTTRVIGVMGMDALEGKKIEDTVHRWQQFCRITDSHPNETVREEKVVELILHRDGTFKGTPEGCLKYLLLNKVDNKKRIEAASMIVELLKKTDFNHEGIILSSIMRQEFQLIKLEGK